MTTLPILPAAMSAAAPDAPASAPAEDNPEAFAAAFAELLDERIRTESPAWLPETERDALAETEADTQAIAEPLSSLPLLPVALASPPAAVDESAANAATAVVGAPQPAGRNVLPEAAASDAPAVPFDAVAAEERADATLSASSTEPVATKPGEAGLNPIAATPAAPQAARAQPLHAPVQYTLQQPLGSERWQGEFGQTVQFLVRAEQQSAILHVSPPELGPIEVRIDVAGDRANLSFTAQHADTRQALEHALPRLRDMLAESGIALGDAQIHAQTRDRQEAEQPQRAARGDHTATAAVQATAIASAPVRVGLVDTFA
ncbi:MAG: flagellar hook-length control protein FliK [Pseudomonadota bacterium]|nr:MAG: hypothetical protein DIU74_06225 [Pseudomonadota bacterium]